MAPFTERRFIPHEEHSVSVHLKRKYPLIPRVIRDPPYALSNCCAVVSPGHANVATEKIHNLEAIAS